MLPSVAMCTRGLPTIFIDVRLLTTTAGPLPVESITPIRLFYFFLFKTHDSIFLRLLCQVKMQEHPTSILGLFFVFAAHLASYILTLPSLSRLNFCKINIKTLLRLVTLLLS